MQINLKIKLSLRWKKNWPEKMHWTMSVGWNLYISSLAPLVWRCGETDKNVSYGTTGIDMSVRCDQSGQDEDEAA